MLDIEDVLAAARKLSGLPAAEWGAQRRELAKSLRQHATNQQVRVAQQDEAVALAALLAA